MAVPQVVWQTATIAAVAKLTPRIKRFLLRPRRWIPFLAGQHLDIRLTAPDGYQAQRSYSVTSEPEMAEGYEIAVELLEDGEVSPYFHEVAQVGDEVEIRGPFGGHFVWTADDGGPLLLVGGGSGMAPLVSMLRHRAAVGSTARTLTICAARTREDVIFRDELIEQDRTDAELNLILALSRDRPLRPQDAGRRIDAALLREGLDWLGQPPRVSYVCGSNIFVEAAAQLLVGLGLPAARIRTERYGGADPVTA
jgi:ferredoxin-NADP reductase